MLIKKKNSESLAKFKITTHTMRHPTVPEEEDIEFYTVVKYSNGRLTVTQFHPKPDARQQQQTSAMDVADASMQPIVQLSAVTPPPANDEIVDTPVREKTVEKQKQRDTKQQSRRERERRKAQQKKRRRETSSKSSGTPKKSSRDNRKPLRRKDRKIDGRSVRRPESYLRGQGGKFAPKPRITETRIVRAADKDTEKSQTRTEDARNDGNGNDQGKDGASPTLTSGAKKPDQPQPATSDEPRPSTSKE
ncbi:luc7-like protein 3 [Monomorium pharaonis]|uniref:luc7-like protein 3 n=1 Tax=Monomorium pharaonis TaxID=307658 RepID=UPI00063F17BA|nr:luc7-like protein 3 [Monomorium pharaonis]